MDAFYASVEIKDNPALADQPVVVGGSPDSRGVVSAASYKAREFGIHSAMPCSRAKRLCPHAVFIFPRFYRYKEISHQIREIFRQYTDLIEPLSLDEAWLDVTSNHISCPSATWIAQKIKLDISRQIGLTSSAGVSFNKFLAKIASDEDKPDGLFVITPENAHGFLMNITVSKIPGVGKVTRQKLQLLGIEKGYQLFQKSEDYLKKHFGKFGGYLHRIIRGIDERQVRPRREAKSIGIENTFKNDYQYGKGLKEELQKLLNGLFKRLKKSNKQGRTLGLKVKFHDFHQITRSVTPDNSLLNEEIITRLAFQKLHEVAVHQYPGVKIRLLGLSISNFSKKNPAEDKNKQLDIFHFLNQQIYNGQ